MFCSRSFNRFPAIRSLWCIREAHRRRHRRKSTLKMNELENEKVNMIYAETQRGGSSLRWWGAPLESISAERRSTGWDAIRLHHSSSLYCLPICEWQESRRHLCAYNLTCTHEALTHEALLHQADIQEVRLFGSFNILPHYCHFWGDICDYWWFGTKRFSAILCVYQLVSSSVQMEVYHQALKRGIWTF